MDFKRQNLRNQDAKLFKLKREKKQQNFRITPGYIKFIAQIIEK